MEDFTGEYIDRYRVTGLLGRGGMAVVYKAHDTRLERDVAIKLIRRGAFPPEMLDQILKRFEREAKSLARLSHPNILKVYDYGEFQGSPYLVLEYSPSANLEERLKDQPMPWRDAVALILPVARALEFSHRQGIIHRDIKPSNVLFSPSGEPMLSDFGIAKVLNYEATATLTGTGVGIGTPAYMAPEQWTGETSELSDQYSLGVVLYQAITGRIPFESDTPAGIIIRQTTEALPSPKKYVPDLPDGVERMLSRALAKDPKERYPNISAFIEALEGSLSGTGVTAPPEMAAATMRASRQEIAEATLLVAEPPIPATPEARPGPAPKAVKQTAARPRWGLIMAIAGVALVCLIGIAGGGFAIRYFNNASLAAPTPTSTSTATSVPVVITPTLEPTPTEAPTQIPTPADTPLPAEGFDTDPTGNQIAMRFVPAGEFTMGAEVDPALAECLKYSTNCQRIDFEDEVPVHSVQLDAFYIDKFEVTNALYAACVAAGVCPRPRRSDTVTHPSYYGNPEFDNFPVVWVSWNEATAYCEWRGARLPTEAEWEKGARGTDGRTYPWGEGLDCTRANFATCVGDTVAVGSYESGQSPYGVYEMAGNAWEWVADWYSATYYGESPPLNPPGPETGAERVVRGGSWAGGNTDVHSARRIGRVPTSSGDRTSIRCARTGLP
jgi:serine/threonine-protein kinase